MVNIFILSIYWDPRPEMFSWSLPFLGRPILWYGFFFALGFFLGYLIFKQLLKKNVGLSELEAKSIAEKTSFYVGISTVVGARLFDVLFYQSPSTYVHDPFEVVRFWQGGLSSHGAITGILIGLWLLKKKLQSLSLKQLIDLSVIPALVAGAFIRLGNFFNQEIIGIPTSVPWAVLFAHPADGSIPVPRHPVQLYEALFYLVLASFLWFLRTRFKQPGKMAGFFFMSCFSFRFFIEFLKAHQSEVLSVNFPLDMGQLLSLPLILLGVYYSVSAIRIKRDKGKHSLTE